MTLKRLMVLLASVLSAVTIGVAILAVHFLLSDYTRLGPVTVNSITDIPEIGSYFGKWSTRDVRYIKTSQTRENVYHVTGVTGADELQTAVNEHPGWLLGKEAGDQPYSGIAEVMQELDPEALAHWSRSNWVVYADKGKRLDFYLAFDPDSGRFWTIITAAFSDQTRKR